ncbi:MAG TPA: DUF2779 domain-containing protein [Epsilonproteobacteria bacterium]|nr:DUF2779 domain-containing protein [Campylobacterota bacterium]
MTLSKSQYIRGLQCHKSLWLLKNRPELREEPDRAQESLFDTGYSAGEAAKELFPGGVEIEFDADNFKGMLDKTKELIENGTEVIYEASFSVNGIFVMIDLLVKRDDFWDMYEVKASTEVKQYQLNDASIQWHVVSQVIPLDKAYIVYIDKTYERLGDLEVDKLFKRKDVTEMLLEMQEQIEPNLEEMKEVLGGDMPDVDIGGHCSDPFGCDFKQHCWKHIPSPSVFNLYWMNWSKKFEMYYKGIISYQDIPKDQKLSFTQQLQVSTARTKEPHINPDVIRSFVQEVEYPINFFDFETFFEAIPRFSNQRPYQQIPFQYSLHILHEDGTLEHREFLADEHSDPRDELITKMLSDITERGSIIAYNQAFEKRMIRELATCDSNRSKELLALNERFLDLIVPFRNGGYYHPDFNGSFSIKSVLPALFPGDPELDYKKLGSVQNGGDAMDTFAKLHLLKYPSKREAIRADLLAYCRLDTLAMVRIWEMLRQLVKVDILPVGDEIACG